ncbi:AI-2E family transporter [Gemmatimonadota bacterium]
MDQPRESTWRALQAASVFLVLGFFFLSLWDQGLLSPFLLFWILVAVLLPFRGIRGQALFIAVMAVLTAFWLLHTTGFLLAPFVLALVLAYVLDPLVDRMTTRRISRSLAIILLTLPVLALLAVAVLFGIPALGTQAGQLIADTPEFLTNVAGWLEALWQGLQRVDLPLIEEETLLERLRSVDSAAVVAFLEERQTVIWENLWSGILGLGRGVGSVVSILGYVVLTPVLTFYLLRDYDRIVERVGELLPRGSREGIVALAGEYDRLLSRYLRGQVTVALMIGGLTAVGLWIAQFPHALLLAVLVAVFGVVPYLGLVLSLIPALFIALVSGSVVVSLLKIAVVYGVAQALEGTVISPRIVGESVGLHPVWVVLALVVGGFAFGFVGLLIGVPLAVGIKLLVVRGVERYQASELYTG